MPKPSRSPEDVEEVKQNIMETAIQLILDIGYDSFSMRKLAAKLGVTATTIYNYYASKDELYLNVLERGFENLYQLMLESYQTSEDPLEQLRANMRTYMKFGIENSNYYNLMFVANAPCYRDFVNRPEEPIALKELKTAQKAGGITKEILAKLVEPERVLSAHVKIWSYCHGIVTLVNNDILNYTVEPTEDLLESMINDMINMIIKG
jgi:AcrR family transcriptional regulator